MFEKKMEELTAKAIRYMQRYAPHAPFHLIDRLCTDRRLVFRWPFIGNTYEMSDIAHGLCKRLNCENPNEILVYFMRDEIYEDVFVRFDIDRQAMREYFVHAHQMPDPLPDPPCDMCIEDVVQLDGEMLRVVSNVVSRNRKLRDAFVEIMQFNSRVEEYLQSLINLDVRVPLHVVTSVHELAQRNLRGTVYTLFPFYTTCCRPMHVDEFDELMDTTNPRLFDNDLASLIVASSQCRYEGPELADDFAIDLPRRSTIFYDDWDTDTRVTLTLDLDSITDALDRDGWTLEMRQFAREQLKIDKYHKYALTRMLRARKDVPDGIL